MKKIIINSTKTLYPHKSIVQLIKNIEKKVDLVKILAEVYPEVNKECLIEWEKYWTTIPLPVILKLSLISDNFRIVKEYIPSFKLVEEKVRNGQILLKVISKNKKQKRENNLKFLKIFGIVKNLGAPTLFILQNYRVRGEKSQNLLKSLIPIFGREKELANFLGVTEKVISNWKVGKHGMLLGSYLLLSLLTDNSKEQIWKGIKIYHPASKQEVDKSIIQSILNGRLRSEINRLSIPKSFKKQLGNFELVPIRVEISKKSMKNLIEKALAKFGTARLLGYFSDRSENTILHWKNRYRTDFETILKLCRINGINPVNIVKKEKRKFYTLRGDFVHSNFYENNIFDSFEETITLSESKEISELLLLVTGKIKEEVELLFKQNKRIPLSMVRKAWDGSETKYKEFLLGKTIAPKSQNPLYHKITIPKLIEDEDLLYLAGIIISDGSLRLPYISVISKDVDFLENILRPKFEKFWNINFKLKPNAKVYKLIGCSKALCYFFSLYFEIPVGYKCSEVVVPRIVNRNNALPFLAGLFDGDGSLDKGSGIEFSTLSLKLAISLYVLLIRIGLDKDNMRIEVEENPKKYRTKYRFTLKLGRENTRKIMPLLQHYSYKLKRLNLGEIEWI